MPYKTIGRLLFPKHPAWKQKREARILVAAIGVAFIFAGIVAVIIFLQGHQQF